MTARKPPERRQNRITRDIGPIREAGKAPPMPRGLCKAAQDAWTAYWSDHVSGATTGSDLALITRWIKNLDRYHRLVAQADRKPVVRGSKGQDIGNPLYQLVFKLEAAIEKAEQQLGVGPLNRHKLGLMVTESFKSLADLNAEAEDDCDTYDIRLTAVPDT
jgi:P27 family predicted phage terminase small subunit